MEKKEKKIQILKDGPYMVSGDVPLHIEHIVPDSDGNGESYEKGKVYDHPEQYALCRCGHTKNRPFCDGTHQEIGFDGTETAGHKCYCDEARVYSGETIELLDERALCASARFCDRYEDAWNLTEMSSPDHPEYEERAIYEATHCPAGRITVRKDGELIEPDLPQEIALLEDPYYDAKAPIFVKGGIKVTDADGVEYEERNRRALCRCGESKNKPFCDGTHLNCEHMKGSDG